jgi:hypothetical protein
MTKFFEFLNSSVGRKWLMALTGLFLSLFLIVHVSGNLQLFKDDGGMAFNQLFGVHDHVYADQNRILPVVCHYPVACNQWILPGRFAIRKRVR